MERAMLCQRKPSSLILERILLCATSALASALATLSFSRYLRRRRSYRKGHAYVQPSAALEAEAARQEKQLLTAVAKVKELEAALGLLHTEKDLLGSESAGAAEKLAAAAKVEKELKHQLGKVKLVAKEVQDMHTALYEEKEAALAKAKALQKEKEDLEQAVADTRGSVSGLQRSVAAQTSGRKAAERQVKQLELDISAALASKARTELQCTQAIQDLEHRLAATEAAKRTAEDSLEQYKARVAPTRTKIEALGKEMLQLQDRFRQTQHLLAEAQARLAAERQRRGQLEPQFVASQRRARELEMELRVTRETARSVMKRTSSRGSIDSQHSLPSGS